MIPRTLPLGETPRILVVEDEVLIRAVIAEELRIAGCDVTEVDRAEDALSYLSAGGVVDLVFSDIRLQGELSGLDLVRELRRRDPALPIFLTSATAGAAEVAGDWWFIPKPYNIPALIRAMFEALGVEPQARRA